MRSFGNFPFVAPGRLNPTTRQAPRNAQQGVFQGARGVIFLPAVVCNLLDIPHVCRRLQGILGVGLPQASAAGSGFWESPETQIYFKYRWNLGSICSSSRDIPSVYRSSPCLGGTRTSDRCHLCHRFGSAGGGEEPQQERSELELRPDCRH